MKHTTGDQLERNFTRLNKPGTYHLMVTSATETPTKKDGTPLPDGKFQLNVEVLAGTNADEVGKTAPITSFHPSSKTTDDQKARDQMREDRLLLALNMLPPTALEYVGDKLQLRKGIDLDIDLSQATGRQFIAKFDSMDKDDKYLKTEWYEAYHVDDPAVAAIPKNTGALGTIRPEWRWMNGRPRGVEAAATPPPAANANQGSAAPQASQTQFDNV